MFADTRKMASDLSFGPYWHCHLHKTATKEDEINHIRQEKTTGEKHCECEEGLRESILFILNVNVLAVSLELPHITQVVICTY
jgi:hypothetical protein